MARPTHAPSAPPHGDRQAATPEHGAGHLKGPQPAPHSEPPGTLGNLALQQLLANGLLRRRLAIGAASDPAEAEADRMADAALGGTPHGPVHGPAHDPVHGPVHAGAGGGAMIRRKPRTHDLLASAPQVSLGGGRPLGRRERDFFEPRFNADLGDVRLHDDAQAAASAASVNARAFSLGNRIAFGAGQYQPDSHAGQHLLAHELAHVLQADGAPTLRRQPLTSSTSPAGPLSSTVPSGPMCTKQPEAKPEEQVCKATPVNDPANPTVLNLAGSVDERVAAFKLLVKTTAIHRLLDNRRNLGTWAGLVSEQIPAGDLAAIGMMQSGATGPYFELQGQRDPLMRELRSAQALGQFRACTGCHLEKEISASRGERQSMALESWRTPDEMRAGVVPASRFDLFAGGKPGPTDLADLMKNGFGPTALPAKKAPLAGPAAYRPPAGSNEARLHRMFPDPAATREALERAAPIMEALGPAGYQVLPKDLLAKLENASAGRIRTLILDAIATRQENYLELIGKIRDGEIGYEFFGPVVKKLLPLADAEVQAAIQDEMDTKHFWDKVEQVVVAAMTALALLLAIFPPTSALGIALFASLELSLGYYGVQKGNEAIRLGEAFKLGTGANDVFTQEQQQSADAMIMGGFLSVATGYLGIGGGLLRTASAAFHFVPPPTAAALVEAGADSTALAKTGGTGMARTIQQGEYVMTIAEDGAMMATVSSRPDLLIMVRGDTATLYQLLEGGGMRVVARATLPARGGGGGAAANPFLGAGTEMGMAGGAAREGPLITPAPRDVPQLTAGAPTSYAWDEIGRMRQPMLWQEREIHMQELYGSAGQQHFPVPGTGGRYVDVPVDLGGGRFYFAGEVKSYSRWIGVPGQRGGILNEVGLTERIEEQIARDVWLRDNVPGFDPRWMFTDAPPSAALRQALRDARIVFIEYL